MEEVLCPECLTVAPFDVVTRPDTFTIRGDEITINAQVAVCVKCGEEVGVVTLDDASFRAAYAVYRARHNLLQPQQIKSIRSMYGLGQKAFARLLGWGDVTLARYESGSLQSVSHDQALRLAEDPANVRRLLESNSDRLSPEQTSTVRTRLGQLSIEHEGMLAREEAAQYCAGIGVRKLREMSVFYASLPHMWRTKLNKMLFYADFLHAKRHGVSVSGARYVHMQFGPVPADFYTLQAALVDDASIDERQATVGDCSGTVFVSNRPADTSIFSAGELETLRAVAEAFDGWSASRITEFSHEEPAWKATTLRETIDYRYAQELQLS